MMPKGRNGGFLYKGLPKSSFSMLTIIFSSRPFHQDAQIQYLCVHRRHGDSVFSYETGGFGFAPGDAKTAADASIPIHAEGFAVRDDRVHLTALHADAAAGAGRRVDARVIVGGKKPRGPWLLLCGGQHAAAAAAANADAGGLSGIARLQHHSPFFRHVQNLQTFVFGDFSGPSARRVAVFQ